LSPQTTAGATSAATGAAAAGPTIVSVIGNPRPDSRTHGLARTLSSQLAGVLGADHPSEVDLAQLAGRVLDRDDQQAAAATERVLGADVLVLASPTYKATYSGLLKAFLDRLGTGALAGSAAVPILLGGAQNHRLAIDVHFTPLLYELGASVPARGLFVLEEEVDTFPAFARDWCTRHAATLASALSVSYE
jgi:FMN reductase